MRNKLIVKRPSVFLDLNKIESHSGYFRDDDPSEGICHSQISVEQLKLDDVA
jgi:hypothetical protein